MKRTHIFGAGAAAIIAAGFYLATEMPMTSPAMAEESTEEAGTPTSDQQRILADIQNDPLAPTVEPENYDVTIVMFSDYQCPYCRMMHPAIESVLESDDKVRVVYRDWPIFGGPSDRAAKAAIASQYQDMHLEFHDALMTSSGSFTQAAIRQAADEAGVDWEQLESDMQTHSDDIDALLDRTRAQAALLGFQGTPGLLVGTKRIPGALDEAMLRNAIEAVRKESKSSNE